MGRGINSSSVVFLTEKKCTIGIMCCTSNRVIRCHLQPQKIIIKKLLLLFILFFWQKQVQNNKWENNGILIYNCGKEWQNFWFSSIRQIPSIVTKNRIHHRGHKLLSNLWLIFGLVQECLNELKSLPFNWPDSWSKLKMRHTIS